MKGVIFLVSLCVAYSTAQYVTTLGNCKDYELIGNVRVYEKADKNKFRNKTFKFPKGFHKPDFIIRGIRYYDYETVPSDVIIVDGKFGDRRVWLKVRSQRGYAIKVIFEFCGEKLA